MPAKALATATREGKYEAEGWRVRKDGTRFFASVVIDAIRGDQGELLGFAKITRDITERRKSRGGAARKRAALPPARERRHRLRALHARSQRDRHQLERRRRAHQGLFGRRRSSASISRASIPRATGPPACRRGRCRQRGQTGRYEEEGWRVRKDGSFFWASVVIDPIRDEQGSLGRLRQDHARHHRTPRGAGAISQRAQSQLAEAQKMDALGQLTGGVAHDFNNLLMIVSGHIQTLKKRSPHDPKAARAAEAIELAAQRGASLTRQLLTFSRRQRVNPQPIALSRADRVDPGSAASGARRRVRLAIRHSCRRSGRSRSTSSEFEIALVNLVVNARDAMPDGGMVTISAENIVLDRSRRNGLSTATLSRITVADTGVGIPPDVIAEGVRPVLHHQAGRQGHRPRPVAGARLRPPGRRHASRSTATLGKGTRVTIYLPRAATAPAIAEARARRARGRPTPARSCWSRTIPRSQSASADLLEQLGYAVRWVADAEAALQELERDASIDLVVSDIVMPGRMDGLALARAVQGEVSGPAGPARHRLQRSCAGRPTPISRSCASRTRWVS